METCEPKCGMQHEICDALVHVDLVLNAKRHLLSSHVYMMCTNEARIIYDVDKFLSLKDRSDDLNLYLCVHEVDKETKRVVELRPTRLHTVISQKWDMPVDAMPHDLTLLGDPTIVHPHFHAVLTTEVLSVMTPPVCLNTCKGGNNEMIIVL
jgi:hypothetical protein